MSACTIKITIMGKKGNKHKSRILPEVQEDIVLRYQSKSRYKNVGAEDEANKADDRHRKKEGVEDIDVEYRQSQRVFRTFLDTMTKRGHRVQMVDGGFKIHYTNGRVEFKPWDGVVANTKADYQLKHEPTNHPSGLNRAARAYQAAGGVIPERFDSIAHTTYFYDAVNLSTFHNFTSKFPRPIFASVSRDAGGDDNVYLVYKLRPIPDPAMFNLSPTGAFEEINNLVDFTTRVPPGYEKFMDACSVGRVAAGWLFKDKTKTELV